MSKLSAVIIKKPHHIPSVLRCEELKGKIRKLFMLKKQYECNIKRIITQTDSKEGITIPQSILKYSAATE